MSYDNKYITYLIDPLNFKIKFITHYNHIIMHCKASCVSKKSRKACKKSKKTGLRKKSTKAIKRKMTAAKKSKKSGKKSKKSKKSGKKSKKSKKSGKKSKRGGSKWGNVTANNNATNAIVAHRRTNNGNQALQHLLY
jgi:hypothetical protein